MTDHSGRAVAFWLEICIIRKQLYFYQKRPQKIALPQHGNLSGSREVFVYV